jgi:hypothetical protein
MVKYFVFRICAVMAVYFAVAGGAAAEVPMTNADVEKLVRSGVADTIIIAAIKGAPMKRFDTSPKAIAQLKVMKVSDAVIAAMSPSAVDTPRRPAGEAPAHEKSEPSSIPWVEVTTQGLAAFIGAIFAFGFALWIAHQQREDSSTAAMINEFSSREMLVSRFVTARIAKQVAAGEVTLRDVALSSVQDCPIGFEGRTIDTLTEHQHMSYVVGWIRRLAVQLQHRWVNRKVIAIALGGSLQWSLPFLLRLADEAERVMKVYPSETPPAVRASWIYSVRYVDAQLKRVKFYKRLPTSKARSQAEVKGAKPSARTTRTSTTNRS